MEQHVFSLMRLDGKVAIITGGHAWLGNDMARALTEAGCAIIITSRELPRAEAAAAQIADAYGVEAIGLALEQTEHTSVERMAAAAFAWKGRIDILINNAGGGSGQGECSFLERDPETMRNMLEVNLLGPLYCCQAVGRYMARSGNGSIINIASVAGLIGRDRRMYTRTHKMQQPIEYGAAKGGVISFTRDLAAYMAPYGVRVNSISPGGFDKGEPREFVAAYGDATPLGRMGRMGKEIKGAALYLAGNAASYVTGQNLVVDGGFSIWK